MTIDKSNDNYWAKLHELYCGKDWLVKLSYRTRYHLLMM